MEKIKLLAFGSEGFAPKIILFGSTIENGIVKAAAYYIRMPVMAQEVLTQYKRVHAEHMLAAQYIINPDGLLVKPTEELKPGLVVFGPFEIAVIGGKYE